MKKTFLLTLVLMLVVSLMPFDRIRADETQDGEIQLDCDELAKGAVIWFGGNEEKQALKSC